MEVVNSTILQRQLKLHIGFVILFRIYFVIGMSWDGSQKFGNSPFRGNAPWGAIRRIFKMVILG